MLRLCSKDVLSECPGVAVGGRDEITPLCRNQPPQMLPENAALPSITTPVLVRYRVCAVLGGSAVLAIRECSR
jgi:hypothetical protein